MARLIAVVVCCCLLALDAAGDEDAEVAEHWARASQLFRHSGIPFITELLLDDLARFVLPHCPGAFAGERVLEVGIGDGALGEWMLTVGGAAHWTGVDVSAASLEEARTRLIGGVGDESRFALDGSSPADLSSHAPDTIITIKTMQHFPSAAYTQRWLRGVAASGARRAILQWVGPCSSSAGADEEEVAAAAGEQRPRPWSECGGALDLGGYQGARCAHSVAAVEEGLGAAFELAWLEPQPLPRAGSRSRGRGRRRERSSCNLWAGFERRAADYACASKGTFS